MRTFAALGLVFGVICSIAPSGAMAAEATVQSVQGRVLIDHGAGFVEFGAQTKAQAGDRVMASPASTGKIVYADGCSVNVTPGSVVSVGANSPCKAPYLQDGDSRRDSNWGVVPLLIGVTAAAVAYCISGPCNDDNENRGRASP